MTFGELKTLVSIYLDDLNFGFHTESIVKQYLNDAQREVQKYLIQSAQNYYSKCKQTTLEVDGCEYLLPTDLLKLHRAELVLSGESPNEVRVALNPISLNQQDLYQPTPGLPVAYCLQKNSIKLFPIPNEEKTLKITYSYKVQNMTADSDSPDVPLEYEEMLALLAARTGYIRDDKPVGDLNAKIEEYKLMMKQTAASRVQQTARRVITTGWDGGYTY